MNEEQVISRRRFLQTAGIAGAGALLASCNAPVGVPFTPVSTSTHAVPTKTILPTATKNLPKVDMRPVIRNIGLAVRQQTDLAPCAVHAFTFLLEYMSIRHIFSDLSEAYLQYMTFQVEKPAMKGGENFWALNIGYQKWGFVPQALVSNQSRPSGGQPSRWGAVGVKGCRLTQTFIKEWDSSTGATPEQLDAAVGYLDSDIPVAVGLLWPKKYRSYPIGGIPAMNVPHAENKWDVVYDGHAVALVGYGRGPDFPGGGYFIFRNSWGTAFEEQGYGYMPFGYALNYTNDLCVLEAVFEKGEHEEEKSNNALE
jgi:hypothetical protein